MMEHDLLWIRASVKQQRWGTSILGLEGREGHHCNRILGEIYKSARRRK